MCHFINTILGFVLLAWYGAIRWWWFDTIRMKFIRGDIPIKDFWCLWAYNPMNMITAFLSALFMVVTLFYPSEFPKSFTIAMLWLGAFLAFRNFYYVVFDIMDYKNDPSLKQAVFIGLDVIMIIYTFGWMHCHKALLG